MSQVFLPLVTNDVSATDPDPTQTPTPTPMPRNPGQRVVIDPITRIEGHLRLEVEVENGVVTDVWSSSTMFRGLELILKGRDPRDAWVFAQRICGVCTTVHAIASVRAVENALDITAPDNARLLRNIIEAAQFVQDHVIHFYHLHALDWVDIVNALQADPSATSDLAQSLSDWPNSSAGYFTEVKQRVQALIDSGQLGLLANGYWGHSAYQLPPEANLMAVAHYLEALSWQREYIKIHTLLGGKNPHPQTYLVGGMASPIDPSSDAAINPARLAQLRMWAQQGLDFVNRVYLPDLLGVAGYYKNWAALGEGVGNYLAFGDFPDATGGDPADLWMPRGVVWDKNLAAPPESLDHQLIEEHVTHSWYRYTGGDATGKHPWEGETQPNLTGPEPPYELLDVENKYSWLKAPRYRGQPMEVGPLARMTVAYAAGHAQVREEVDRVLSALGVGPAALFSTLGRTAARGIETRLLAERMATWIDELEVNMNSGDLNIHAAERWNPATWPTEARGWGATEAPRGALGHWVNIRNGQIENYQAVVPTTWNGSPRDAAGQRGVWEEALIGTPVADPTQPVEILRTIHSFDPCMACAVHVVDLEKQEVTRVEVMG